MFDNCRDSQGSIFGSFITRVREVFVNFCIVQNEDFRQSKEPQDNLIFHSDRGVQYASAGYREALAEYNITQSMSRKGEPYDNAVAENFFSCLKCELVHHKHYRTRSEAQADIFAYIEAYYNSVRPQSALNWLSPVEYEHLLSIYAAKVA